MEPVGRSIGCRGAMLSFSTQIRVRYAETDMMGVAYHSNYFIWFEIARVHMLDEIGLSYREIERAGYRLPVLEAHARFLQPARFDDVITLKASILEKPGRIRLRIDYEAICDNRMLCTGYTKHAFVDSQGRPTRAPENFIQIMNEALSDVESSGS